MYSRILVPVDGSEASTLGLQEAVRLAKALHACIRVVHVIDSVSLLSVTTGVAGYSLVMESLRKAGGLLLAEAQALVAKEGIEVDTALVEAATVATGECVVRKAREYHADLIVCGTHGRRGLERVLMGSDAEYIVRHAPVPVLLVRTHVDRDHKQHAA